MKQIVQLRSSQQGIIILLSMSHYRKKHITKIVI